MISASARAERPLPFTPADLPAHKILIRAVAAHCVAVARGHGELPEQICRQYWPRDQASFDLLNKASVSPASTSVTGWSAELVASATASFVGALQDSAAARLIEASTLFNLPRYATVHLPRASSTGTPQWVLEGAPIAVGQGVLTAPTLGPGKKVALVETCSREISEIGPVGAESMIEIILRDGAARVLDLSMLSATAATAAQPAGLFNSISPLTATTGGGLNAVFGDLRSLVDAIVAAGGSSRVYFVASPGRTLALLGYMPTLAGRIFASSYVPSGTLMAVDANSLCVLFGADPEIVVSKETLLHMEDTTPLPIASSGSPNTVAAPVRSMFQSDTLAIRLVILTNWQLRVSGAAAWINSGLSW